MTTEARANVGGEWAAADLEVQRTRAECHRLMTEIEYAAPGSFRVQNLMRIYEGAEQRYREAIDRRDAAKRRAAGVGR